MITAELDASTIEIANSIDNVAIDSANITAGYDNSYNVDVEDLSDLDITVAKKEYAIVGDDVYIPQLYDDAPQWMKDLVQLVVDVSMTTNNTQLINDLVKMLQEFAVSYVPLNQYTQSIVDLSNEDEKLMAFIETLNSNFNNGLSESNAQIINLMTTKASKDEVLAQVIQTIAAELTNPNSNLAATVARLDQAIATEQAARASSMSVLTASLNNVSEGVEANAEVINTALAYVGIDEAGASTGTGLSAYLEASDGTIGGADSQLSNTIRVTAEGVESKWAYNSVVNINGEYRKSGFGLTSNNFSGNGTQEDPYTSEFWIDATKLRFTNSNATGTKAPFTIDASGTTPQIKFNGIVEFSNVANTPAINKTFVQTNQPTSGMNIGDTWIDTDDGNALYTYNGSTWTKTQTGAKTYLQISAPTSGMKAGDIWVDSDDNYKQYRYNGSSWVVVAYDPAIAINTNTTTINGGKITTGSITAAQIQAGTITADRINTSGLIADDISTNTLNGKTINGGIINGAVINSSIIKSSYLDLSADLTIVTNFIISSAMYNSWPSGYSDAVYISGSNTYRIPSVSPLMESTKSATIADVGGVLASTIRSYNCGYAGHNLKCVKYNPTITIGGNGVVLKSEGAEMLTHQWVLTNKLRLMIGGVQLVETYANVYRDNHDLLGITIYIDGRLVLSGSGVSYFNKIKTEVVNGNTVIEYYQKRWDYSVNGVSFSVRYDYNITYNTNGDGTTRSATQGNLSIVVEPGTYTLHRYDDPYMPLIHCATTAGAGRVPYSPYSLAYIPTAYIGNISILQGY